MTDTLLVKSPIVESSVSWGTMVQTIAELIHRSGPEDLIQIQIAIIKAMRHYRWERFHFNETKHYMWFVENQFQYPMGNEISNELVEIPSIPVDGYVPRDIIKIDSIKIKGEDDANWSRPLKNVQSDEIRQVELSESRTGTPRGYAWYAKTLTIYSPPNRNFLARVEYVRDIGVPIYKYSATNGWEFLTPWTLEPIDNEWNSDYFVNADEMIMYRAMWDLYAHYLEDSKNAMDMFDAASLAHRNLRKARVGYKAATRRPATYV